LARQTTGPGSRPAAAGISGAGIATCAMITLVATALMTDGKTFPGNIDRSDLTRHPNLR
jgi:hypothetical protein